MLYVVSTSLLSKGWNNPWTTTPYLNFSNLSSNNLDVPYMFRNFVNRALISWKGTKILKFEIFIDSLCHISLSRDLDLWMRFALENQVEELDIYLSWGRGYVYKTLQCLNSYSLLRKLSLVGCSLRMHGSPAWNQLKSLNIRDSYSGDSWISEELINQILLGTPLLDEFDLGLRESKKNMSIMSTSLKRLMIHKYLSSDDNHEINEYKPSLNTVLKICCPNLETLDISGSPYGKCLLTNVSSLTDATLRFHVECYDGTPGESGNELLGETLRQIFPSIQHIEKITLSFWCVEVLGVSLKKYLLSPFPNVKFLTLGLHDRIELGDIINLLGIFPNLQKLVIDEEYNNIGFKEDPPEFSAENFVEFETNLSKSFLLQLKNIEVSSLMCNTSIYRLIGFLLKHSYMLEKLVVLTISGYNSPKLEYFFKVAVIAEHTKSIPNCKGSFQDNLIIVNCLPIQGFVEVKTILFWERHCTCLFLNLLSTYVFECDVISCVEVHNLELLFSHLVFEVSCVI